MATISYLYSGHFFIFKTMIIYPIAKVNLGLQITEKRPDGFHNLETVFYPVPIQDALEVVLADDFKINVTGIELEEDPEQNLVAKAYRLLREKHQLPPVHIHLHKNIPVGAGLGGGSADASYMLIMLNDLFDLQIPKEKILEYALQLGSDCPFFIRPRPVFATGRGEIMNDVPVNLSGYTLVVIKPPIHISTAEAYQHINPAKSRMSLKALVQFPVVRWQDNIRNQFEKHVFSAHPAVKEIKETLYKQGATFALMSGSGSAVFGLFRTEKRNLQNAFPEDYQVFQQKL